MNLEGIWEGFLLVHGWSWLLSSYRLWSKVTQGIKQKNMDMATDAKLAVEDRQRADTRQREERGLVFEPRFFALDEKDGEYKIKLQG